MDSRPLMLLRLTTSPTEEIGSTPQGTLTIFPSPAARSKASAFAARCSPAAATGSPPGRRNFRARSAGDARDRGRRPDPHDVHWRARRREPLFRTLPRFETAAPKYAFLNRLLAVGVGEIRSEGPVHIGSRKFSEVCEVS